MRSLDGRQNVKPECSHELTKLTNRSFTRILCARSRTQHLDHYLLGHNRRVPREITEMLLTNHERRIQAGASVILRIPSTVCLLVASTTASSKESMTPIQGIGTVAWNQAVIGKRQSTFTIPSGSSSMRRQDFVYLQHGCETPVGSGTLVTPLGREIDHDVINLQAWCELTCPTETRDRRIGMFQVGFASDRAIDEWQQVISSASISTGFRSDERCVRVEIEGRHGNAMVVQRRSDVQERAHYSGRVLRTCDTPDTSAVDGKSATWANVVRYVASSGVPQGPGIHQLPPPVS